MARRLSARNCVVERLPSSFERILDARTGTFAASPRLVPLREAVEPIPAPVAGDMLERCLGRYRVPAETSTPAVDVAVVRYGDTLVLDIPIWGRFDLIPRAPFTFEVDDLEWHAMFQPGPGGEIASLRADRLIARRLADGEP